MSSKRDNKYYLPQLEKRDPDTYAAFKAGKISSLRKALAISGIKKIPTRVQALKREFSKATTPEKREFLLWVKSRVWKPGATKSLPVRVPIFAPDERMIPSARIAILKVLADRKMKTGQLMKELGFKPLNVAVSGALHGNRCRNPTLRRAVEDWYAINC